MISLLINLPEICNITFSNNSQNYDELVQSHVLDINNLKEKMHALQEKSIANDQINTKAIEDRVVNMIFLSEL